MSEETSKSSVNSVVQTLGRRMVTQLYMVLRTSRIHDPSNEALVVATENLRNTINSLWKSLGTVQIQFVEDILYFNDVRLRIDPTIIRQVEELREILSERKLGGLSFVRPVESKGLRDFLILLASPIKNNADLESLRSALGEMKNLALELLGPRNFSDGPQNIQIDRKTFSLQTYAKAVVGARESIAILKSGGDPMTSRIHLRRIVQDLVDIATERINFLLKVSAIKSAAEYPYNHAANTCVLAIVIGKALNIQRLELVELGLCAFLADMGFSLIESEKLSSKREYSESEREELRQAMRQNVQRLIGKGRMSAPLIRRAIVAYEHHFPYLNPQTGQPSDLHTYSKIIAVADAYDALTTRRPWREGFPPDEALRILMKNENNRFDPTIVKVLVNLLGMYPLGTVVRLASNELAIVYHNSNNPDFFSKPWVKIVRDARGQEIRKTVIRDLAKENGPQGLITATARSDELGDLDPAMAILI